MEHEIATQDDSVAFFQLSPTICAELAAGLTDQESVKEKYNLTDEQWTRMKESKFFKQMLKQAIEKMAGDLNAGARITLKSELMLEDALPVLDEIAHSKDIPTAARLDAIKQMSANAGRNKPNAEGGPGGSGFAVNISIQTRGDGEPVRVEPALEGETV